MGDASRGTGAKWLLLGEIEFDRLVGVFLRSREYLSRAVKEGGLVSIRTMRPRGVGSTAHNFDDFVSYIFVVLFWLHSAHTCLRLWMVEHWSSLRHLLDHDGSNDWLNLKERWKRAWRVPYMFNTNHSERIMFSPLTSSASFSLILPLLPLLCGLGRLCLSPWLVPGVPGTLRNSLRSLFSMICLCFFFFFFEDLMGINSKSS